MSNLSANIINTIPFNIKPAFFLFHWIFSNVAFSSIITLFSFQPYYYHIEYKVLHMLTIMKESFY